MTRVCRAAVFEMLQSVAMLRLLSLCFVNKLGSLALVPSISKVRRAYVKPYPPQPYEWAIRILLPV